MSTRALCSRDWQCLVCVRNSECSLHAEPTKWKARFDQVFLLLICTQAEETVPFGSFCSTLDKVRDQSRSAQRVLVSLVHHPFFSTWPFLFHHSVTFPPYQFLILRLYVLEQQIQRAVNITCNYMLERILETWHSFFLLSDYFYVCILSLLVLLDHTGVVSSGKCHCSWTLSLFYSP